MLASYAPYTEATVRRDMFPGEPRNLLYGTRVLAQDGTVLGAWFRWVPLALAFEQGDAALMRAILQRRHLCACAASDSHAGRRHPARIESLGVEHQYSPGCGQPGGQQSGLFQGAAGRDRAHRYAHPALAERIGSGLDCAWYADAFTAPPDRYVVCEFVPDALYGGRPTYIYSAPLRSDAGKVIGGIGAVFDSAPQRDAVVSTGLAQTDGAGGGGGLSSLPVSMPATICPGCRRHAW